MADHHIPQLQDHRHHAQQQSPQPNDPLPYSVVYNNNFTNLGSMLAGQTTAADMHILALSMAQQQSNSPVASHSQPSSAHPGSTSHSATQNMNIITTHSGNTNNPLNTLSSPVLNTAGPNSAVAPAVVAEEPLYVNAKQYHRILKRREARARWEAQIKNQRKEKGYIHESRHRHAMKRPRGPGGRFLSAAEMAALEANGQLDLSSDEQEHSENAISNDLSLSPNNSPSSAVDTAVRMNASLPPSSTMNERIITNIP